MNLKKGFFILLFIGLVRAASHGNVGQCNAKSELFGCLQWEKDGQGKEDRMRCIDERGAHMPWASAPVRSDYFTIRSGDGPDQNNDPKEYHAGKYVTIFVRVLHYDYKYRGLLLHATNSKGETVGQWGLPTDKPNYDFWHPDTCGDQHVLHANGDIKHLGSRFHFKGPAAGTGPITFQLLLKVGAPNEGEFYYPKEDLVLQEAGNSPQPTIKWYLGEIGDDCHATCKARGLHCNSMELTQASQKGQELGLDALGQTFSVDYPCSFPLIRDCSIGTPAIFDPNERAETKQQCYYHDVKCSTETKPTDFDPSIGNPRCSASHPKGRRFCACGTSQESFDSTYFDDNTASSLVLNHFAVCLMVLLNVFHLVNFNSVLLQVFSTRSMSRFSGKAFLMITLSLIVLGFPQQVEGHNWLISPSRSGPRASMKCPVFKSFHNQIGLDQKIYIEASFGHKGDVMLIVVRKDEDKWLHDPRIFRFASNYMGQAPPSANTAKDNPRVHRTSGVRRPNVRINGKKLFVKQLQYGKDALYNMNPGWGKKQSEQPQEGQYIYEYNADLIKNDKRISYKNSKLPFLEAVYNYKIHKHYPHDYMVIPFSLQGHHGPGHYVVMYKWRGYYDCVDVQLHMAKPTLEWPYGQMLRGPPEFERIDHCQFQDYRAVLSPCYDASAGTAKKCVQNVLTKWARGNDCRTEPRGWGGHSIGVNVVPVINPRGTLSSVKPNIPWDEPMCVRDGEILGELTGKVTTSDIKTLTDRPIPMIEKSGMNCNARDNFGVMTFAEAAKRAAGRINNREYTALSYGGKNVPFRDLYRIPREWWGCRRGYAYQQNNNYNRGRSIIEFTDIPEPRGGVKASDPPIVGTKYKFSFQPKLAITEAGFIADFGLTYRKHDNGLTYGWNCIIDNGYQWRASKIGHWANTAKGYGSVGLEWPCPGTNTPKKWEFLLPEGNGLYEVQSFHSVGENERCLAAGEWKPRCRRWRLNAFRGCVFENDRAWRDSFRSIYYIGTFKYPCRDCPMPSKNIVISDGKFTFDVVDNECTIINMLTIQKIAETETPVFFPGSANPWWQLEIEGGSTPIQNVVVKAHSGDHYDRWLCSRRWLFEGDWCVQLSSESRTRWGIGETREVGEFKHGGFVVSLSDEPCDEETGVCPAAKHTCGHITKTRDCPQSGGGKLCPISVDCGGVRAKYVRVQLPGQKRILLADIKVYPPATQEFIPKEKEFACYAVLTRTPSIAFPPHTIVTDPEDPAFFSTCFYRKNPMYFEPPELQTPQKTGGRYMFGEKCLDCVNLWNYSSMKSDRDNPVFPKWKIADVCVDCNHAYENIQFDDPSITRPATRPPQPPPPPGVPNPSTPAPTGVNPSPSTPSPVGNGNGNGPFPPGPTTGGGTPSTGGGTPSTGGDGNPTTGGGYPVGGGGGANSGGSSGGANDRRRPKTEEEKQKEREVQAHQTSVILTALFVPILVIGTLAFLAWNFYFEPKWKLERRRERARKRKKMKKLDEQPLKKKGRTGNKKELRSFLSDNGESSDSDDDSDDDNAEV